MMSFAPRGRSKYLIASSKDLIELEMGLAFYARASIPYGTQTEVMNYILARMMQLSPANQPPCGFRVVVHSINPENPDDYKVDIERVEESELQQIRKV